MTGAGRRRGGLVVVAGLLLAAVAALFLLDDGEGGTGRGDRSNSGPKLSANQALVFGRVVDAKTKAPIPGAEVLIKQGEEPVTARSDGRGRFSAVVSTGEPFGFETQAPGYMGTAAGAVAGLCSRERFQLNLSLLPAGTREAPPAPLFLSGKCPVR